MHLGMGIFRKPPWEFQHAFLPPIPCTEKDLRLIEENMKISIRQSNMSKM